MRWILASTVLLFALAAGAIEPAQPPPGTPPKPATAGQEAPPPPPAPEADTSPAEEAASPADAEEADAADEELPPLPADTAPGPSPQRFNPTEKVRADFPVSFPIDI